MAFNAEILKLYLSRYLGSTTARTFGGALTVTGGITQANAPSGFGNWNNTAATSGTDTTPANGTQFVTSIFLPVNFTVTNITYLIGSVGGTDKVYAVLYDAAGAVLANTSLTSGGATVGTAANTQTLALTATYAAKGPRLIYVGISMNGNTARLRTVPAFTSFGLWGNSVAQTHGTVAAITPVTTFTADKAPIVFLS
jgi:flagellar capping protein FliD